MINSFIEFINAFIANNTLQRH